MGRFRIAFGVALIGVAAAGCAKVSAATEPQRSSPSPSVTALGPPLSYAGTLAIGPQDSGTPISLGAGNTLVFTLGSQAFPSGLAWGVTSSPPGYLFASSHGATPPFRFQARRAGIVVLIKLRACWVTHSPVGLAVTPAMCTIRVFNSMNTSTYSLRRNTVSTETKSHATIPAACGRTGR
jgi:hypothetical protein